MKADALILPQCPICDSNRTSSLGSREVHQVFRCGRCVGIFIHPSPTPGELRAAYEDPAYFGGALRGGYRDYDEQTKPVLGTFATLLDTRFGKGRGRRILDVGCAYGSHLELAAKRGWNVTGIEVSSHAREVASRRLHRKGTVHASVGELPPGRFDVVILMDVIEHLASPRSVFYDLFSKGAIDAETTVVISTPNAGSARAREMGLEWEYFHPPFHLSYFSPSTMQNLLEELRFRQIEIQGVYPEAARGVGDLNAALAGSAGILAVASGSDFAAFMQERYVPGTWSRLTAYEHLPRYLFASQFASGRKVLDFGCGSGYGAATLAVTAANVTGIDISNDALAWASRKHEAANLTFLWSDDLARRFAGAGMGLVTCFEVIEHLTAAQQEELMHNLSAALAEDGVLVISTPNPKMTCLYGENPFHLHELSFTGFEALLRKSFPRVLLFPEKVRVGVSIAGDQGDAMVIPDAVSLTSLCGPDVCEPAAYVAVCAKSGSVSVKETVHWDSSCDYIFETIRGYPRPLER